MIVRVGNGIFAFATLALFTRLLSPSDYGVYALEMTIASVLSTTLFQWIVVAVGRFYPAHIENPIKIISVATHVFWKITILLALLFVIVFSFHNFFGVKPDHLVILFLITVGLGLHSLALQVANIQSAPFRYGMLSWAKSGGALIASLILIYYGSVELGALIGFAMGLVFSVLAFAPRDFVCMIPVSVDKRLSREMIRYGLPLILNFLGILVVDMSDRFMISRLLGSADVAQYAVAYDLVQQSVGPCMNVLFLAAFPLIVKTHEEEGAVSGLKRLNSLGERLIAVGLPVSFIVGILSIDIAENVFGDNYRIEASAIMPWLAAAIFIGAIKSYCFDVALQLRNEIKLQSYIAIVMALFNITLNLFLLQKYGVIGSAWATLAAFSIGALLSYFFSKSDLKLFLLVSVFMRSLLASSIMAIILHQFASSSGLIWLIAKIILGFLIYMVMALLLNVADCRKLLKL